jgi:ferric-dicitrate binding protein FerR (iron transport regulator)
MTDATRDTDPAEDEELTARLLHSAGRRPAVATDRAARVRQAVHAEWRSVTRRRKVRRRAAFAAVLASAALVAIAFRLTPLRRPQPPAAQEAVATVERIDGYASLRPGDRVPQDGVVETGAAGRIGLRLIDGTSVRFDTGSKSRLLSAAILELSAGAVYVDSGSTGHGVEIRTSFGVARDIGTQFEVRLHGASMQVRVRTGAVEVRRGSDSASWRAGTEIVVGHAGTTSRPVAPYGPEWSWSAKVGPAFDIEGRSLGSLLDHLSHEYGWTLHYADADLARRASTIVLHGSVEGLQPNEILEAVMATTGLEHRVDGGTLSISRSASSR